MDRDLTMNWNTILRQQNVDSLWGQPITAPPLCLDNFVPIDVLPLSTQSDASVLKVLLNILEKPQFFRETRIPIVTVDIAFIDRWWKLILAHNSPFEFLDTKAVFVLGLWHPLHHILKSTWKYFRFITEGIFKILHPKSEWRGNAKSSKISTLMQLIGMAAASFLAKNKSWWESIDWSTSDSRRIFSLFFRFHLPCIFGYKRALRDGDYDAIKDNMRILSVLFSQCNNPSYARATYLQVLQFINWEKRELPVMRILKHSLQSCNEETGELALSVRWIESSIK